MQLCVYMCMRVCVYVCACVCVYVCGCAFLTLYEDVGLRKRIQALLHLTCSYMWNRALLYCSLNDIIT